MPYIFNIYYTLVPLTLYLICCKTNTHIFKAILYIDLEELSPNPHDLNSVLY